MRRTLFKQLNQRAQRILVMSPRNCSPTSTKRKSPRSPPIYVPSHTKLLADRGGITGKPAFSSTANRAHHFKAANTPMAFAPADWRKFYRDRGWEPVEFEEEMSQTARQMIASPA